VFSYWNVFSEAHTPGAHTHTHKQHTHTSNTHTHTHTLHITSRRRTHTHTHTHNLQATFTPSLYYTESKDEALRRSRCAPLLYAETGECVDGWGDWRRGRGGEFVYVYMAHRLRAAPLRRDWCVCVWVGKGVGGGMGGRGRGNPQIIFIEK